MPEPTTPDAQQPRQPGGRVGKYEIVRPLGRGAMGQVYLAHDTVLDRDVALKLMAAHIADDAEAKQRFEREARAIARLTHPNVVTVFDLGSDSDGSLYIAMELLKGRDLQRALREAALPLERGVATIVEVLAGLAAAHQAGIVHRDVKPANIFIQEDGSVKIMDFGMARLATGASTGTGNIVGTADYMSPEQVKAGRVDGRSDLFAVGCMLFELVCGRRPFHADNLMSIFYKITQEEPDLSLVPADAASQALLPVLRRALAKAVEARYQSAHEFAAELRGWLSAYPSSAAPPAALEAPTRVASAAAEPGLVTAAPGRTELVPRTAGEPRRSGRLATGAPRPPSPRGPASRPPAARVATRRGSGVLPWSVGVLVLLVAAGGGWLAWPRARATSSPPATLAPAPAATGSAAPPPTVPATPAAPPSPVTTPATAVPGPPAASAAAALRSAQAAFKAGNYKRTAAAAQSVLREDATNPAAQKLLDDALAGQRAVAVLASADAALARGDLAAAEVALSEARRIAPWEGGLVTLASRLAEAQRRAQQEGQRKAEQARAAQLAVFIDEGSAAMERRQFDAAVAAYNKALALDPGNVVAQTGKSNALTAKTVAEAAAAATAPRPAEAPAHGFVAGRTEARGPDSGGLVGFEDSPGVVVKKTQAAELPGRLVFETSPASPRPGERFRIAVALVNEGSQPIQLSGMTVVTTVDGRKQSGAVPPAATVVAPGARAVVWRTPGDLFWREGTASWTLEVTLKTPKGETYRNTLAWK
ncbi:MAG TPA: protein kinase [Vicinamibacteria bacterium]|nr:protein kinase [Vicinamibacteria bacterium]